MFQRRFPELFRNKKFALCRRRQALATAALATALRIVFLCSVVESLGVDRRVVIGGAAAGVVIGTSTVMTPYATVDDIPARLFKKHSTLRGTVIKVTDGDTIRVRHENLFRSAKDTLKVRLLAVDAPETAHFGKKGQPLGETAKQYVIDEVQDRRVTLKLLSKDQYGRAIARVTYKGGICNLQRRDLAERLLANGLASVYRKGGAQYDGDIESWNRIEARAIARKRGIWKDPQANDPAKYKARLRAAAGR